MARKNWKNYASYGVIAIFGGIKLAAFAGAYSDRTDFQEMPQFASLSIQEVRDGMTMAHFSKIRGIADVLTENGAVLLPATDMRVRFATKISEMKYAQYEGNEDMQLAFEMARSEGEIEAREGNWTAQSLDAYAQQVMDLDERFVTVADSAVAYLLDEGISSGDAEAYVRRSIGIAYMDYLRSEKDPVKCDDPRMAVNNVGHVGVVMDLHEKMHSFFQHRLEQLDVADDAFNYKIDSSIEAAAPVDEDNSIEMEM
ncbi:hypothetical protein LCGC14_0228560 [marine sediment metagenome]|uniref:Uncharacterized protein n=1 Tax=marine sediment metagenome TaxID=412755 RepID=A0A0F9USN3_9ZZZZ